MGEEGRKGEGEEAGKGEEGEEGEGEGVAKKRPPLVVEDPPLIILPENWGEGGRR